MVRCHDTDRSSLPAARSAERLARRTARRMLLTDRSKSHTCRRNLHNRPERIVPELEPLLHAGDRRPVVQSSSPMPIAAPAASSTRLLLRLPGRAAPARRALLRILRRHRSVRCAARKPSPAPSTSPISWPSISMRWCGRASGSIGHRNCATSTSVTTPGGAAVANRRPDWSSAAAQAAANNLAATSNIATWAATGLPQSDHRVGRFPCEGRRA